MAKIKFQNGSKFVTVAASLLAVGGLMSFFKTDGVQKSMALNITLVSAAVAITNEMLSRHYESAANHQLQNILEVTCRSVEKLDQESKAKLNTMTELQALYDLKKSENEKLQHELATATLTATALTRKCADIEGQLKRKYAEDDKRYHEQLTKFKKSIESDLSNRIYRVYNQLAESVKSKIGSDQYDEVRLQLQKFSDNLDDQYAAHCDLLEELASMEGEEFVTNVVRLYSQITDEIGSMRVKFRNLLNVGERLELNGSLEMLGNLNASHTPKQKALEVIRKQASENREQLERIWGKSNENDQSLKQLQDQVSDLLNEIERRNLEIAELKRPLRWSVATRDDLRIGNAIILYFEQLGIVLDRAATDYQKHEAFLSFHTDRNSRYIQPSELNEHSEKLQMLSHTLAPIRFEWDADAGVMKCHVVFAKREKSKTTDLLDKIPQCKDLVASSRRGFLITGHPGSGKTSSMIAISQWLGNEQSMRLALNPHNDEVSSFEKYGFIELTDLEDIYEAIRNLDTEIKLRGEDRTRRQMLIVAVDELGRILSDAPKDLDVMEVLRQVAVEGRKLNVVVLIGNHSQTTTAIGMDSQFREAFYQLYLVGAATHKLNQPNSPQLKRHEAEFIESAPYPVLAAINGKFQACQHPTHSLYREYRDSGNPPIGLVEMKANAVTLAYTKYGDVELLSCSHCGSTDVRENAKGRGRHVCNSCGKSFSS